MKNSGNFGKLPTQHLAYENIPIVNLKSLKTRKVKVLTNDYEASVNQKKLENLKNVKTLTNADIKTYLTSEGKKNNSRDVKKSIRDLHDIYKIEKKKNEINIKINKKDRSSFNKKNKPQKKNPVARSSIKAKNNSNSNSNSNSNNNNGGVRKKLTFGF